MLLHSLLSFFLLSYFVFLNFANSLSLLVIFLLYLFQPDHVISLKLLLVSEEVFLGLLSLLSIRIQNLVLRLFFIVLLLSFFCHFSHQSGISFLSLLSHSFLRFLLLFEQALLLSLLLFPFLALQPLLLLHLGHVLSLLLILLSLIIFLGLSLLLLPFIGFLRLSCLAFPLLPRVLLFRIGVVSLIWNKYSICQLLCLEGGPLLGLPFELLLLEFFAAGLLAVFVGSILPFGLILGFFTIFLFLTSSGQSDIWQFWRVSLWLRFLSLRICLVLVLDAFGGGLWLSRLLGIRLWRCVLSLLRCWINQVLTITLLLTRIEDSVDQLLISTVLLPSIL